MLPRMMQTAPRILLAVSLALVLAFGAGTDTRAYDRPEGSSCFTQKTLAKAKRHMVVAANPLAAEAGLAILRKGGSAVDAAIAVQMVLNVVEPQSSGLGGGAFLLTWDQATKTLLNIDGRETAPEAATPELFLDAAGKPLPFKQAVESGRSVGVPGVLAALKLAHDKYGKLSWAELFAPAITLARDGFQVSPRLAKLLAESDPESFAPAARAYFFDPAGRPRPEGYTLKNPALASTFEAIARDGPAAFYEGGIARDIATAVQSDPRGPGKLAAEDLAHYRAKLREPVCVLYRSFDACGAAPPSSGAVTVGQVLALIEPFDIGSDPLAVQPVHHIVEAERLAFADRARYLADPDFVPAPVAGLLDKSYLDHRRTLIDPNRALGQVTAGTPPNTREGAYGSDATLENVGTSHISIVDDDGNAISMTTSIEQAFGSHLMVRGFLLNNELTDFSFVSEIDGRPVANAPAAGKRPLSSMSPTIVFDREGNFFAALGSPGGRQIIAYVAQALVSLIDGALSMQEAAAAPRHVNTNGPTIIEAGTQLEALRPELERMGHTVRVNSFESGLNGIRRVRGGYEGGADPRRAGVALGD